MSIINCIFLVEKILKHVIKHISQSIRVRDIDNAIISFSKYIYLELVFNNTLKRRLVVDKIQCQVYIVNSFKINMLIDSNILSFKKIILDFVIKCFIIDSCRNIITLIKIISLREKMHKAIRAYDATIVLSYSSIIMSICLKDKCKTKLLRDRNFIFMPIKLSNRFELNEDILNYIINANMCAI